MYTSELLFFFHPFIFTDTSNLTMLLFVSRTLLNVAAVTALLWADTFAALLVALILFLASAFLWLVTAIQNPATPPWLKKVAYVSIVNWSVDLPGISLLLRGEPISKVPTVLIILLNVVCGTLLTFIELAVTPLQHAWGCYPPGSTLSDYKWGVCPRFTGSSEPTPVCDQPGVTCFYADSPEPFETNRTVATNIVGISIAIYLIALRGRTLS